MMTKLSEFAVTLAQNGFHIFPCQSGSKLPAIKDFPNKATADPVTVEAWWNGTEHNIGVSTSHFATDESLVVVDVDVKAGKRGDLSLLQLEMEGFALPETFEVSTPSGGRHLITARLRLSVRELTSLVPASTQEASGDML